MKRLLAAMVVAVATGFAVAEEPSQRDLLEAVERQLKAVRAKAGPAVVCVVVSRSEHYPKPEKPAHPGVLGGFDAAEYLKVNPGMADRARRLDLRDPGSIPDHGYAGGVIIDPAGLVLVNYQSIEGATKIYVHLPGGKGSYADIHAADARSDLAVLKLLTPPADLKAIQFGEVRLHNTRDGGQVNVTPGKLVVHMANSYTAGFTPDRASASLGSISNVRRLTLSRSPGGDSGISRSVYNYSPILEYEARQNLAVSGGALLNIDGEMIGITTVSAGLGNGGSGNGHALPLSRNLRRIIEVLRRGEEVEYAFLGVVLDNESPGITLGYITPRSPAWDAGLSRGDRIIAIDGHESKTYEDLLLYLGSALAGTKTRLQVQSAGRTREVEVTLAKFKNDTPFIASVRPAPVFGLRVDYTSMLAQALNDFSRRNSGVPHGVTIREIEPGSPAAAKFKDVGENNRWVITHVNGVPVRQPADFYKAAKGQKAVKLVLVDTAEPGSRSIEMTLP